MGNSHVLKVYDGWAANFRPVADVHADVPYMRVCFDLAEGV